MKRLLFILVLCLLLTGCIRFEVNHLVKRNGNLDIELKAEVTEDKYQAAIQRIYDNAEVAYPAKISKRDNSISFRFNNLEPGVSQQLFKPFRQNTIYSRYEPQIAMLNPEFVSIDKRFEFPDYYYDYRMTVAKSDKNAQVEFSVKPVGKIIETNGEIDGRYVRFDVDLSEGGIYTVSSKESFFMNMLSRSWIILLIAVLAVFVFFVIRKVHVPHMPEMHMPKKAAPKHIASKRLIQFVEKARKLGLTDSEIRKKLVAYDWDRDEIEDALSQ